MQEGNNNQDILNELKINDSVQTAACTRNCRYAVFAIMAVTWGILKESTSNESKIVMIILLFLGVIYMMVETLRYYQSAKITRCLYTLKADDLISDEGVVKLMKKYTDKAFEILKYQVILCIIMGAVLGFYVLYYGI